MDSFVLGVDVGGTNTDTAILCGTRVVAKAKVPTSRDKTRGVVDSIKAALDSIPEETRAQILQHLSRVSIGTTHFTNAVKKRDGGSFDKVAVLRLCGSASRGLPPYTDFPEDLKDILYGGSFMVDGGLEYNADEMVPINPDEIRGCVRQIVDSDPPVRNVVISGVFSPCDEPCGRQEKEVEEIMKSVCPELSCTLSHEIGMLGLIERENAAVLNESLKRLARSTISAFQEALGNLKINCPFYLTQNDGTMISAEEAMMFPILTFSSGPTNSMRGAAFLSGLSDAIVVDIGGTTTDVGVLRNGFPREASTHVMIGDVRTNFCMPDVQCIPLGGGTLVNWNEDTDSVSVGPNSVEYRIKQEALCFGGTQCTTTDIAMAAGVAPNDICQVPEEALSGLSPQLVYAAMREMRKMIETAIDSMKTEKEDVPVLLVGGGCILVDTLVPLKGASQVILPGDHWDVANAVGAALGTVGGASDIIVNLGPIKEMLKKQLQGGGEDGDAGGGDGGECDETKLEECARELALEKGRESARNEVITKKGAVPSSVYIHSQDISSVAYVMNRVRVKVKAIGALTVKDADTANPKSESVQPDSRTRIENDTKHTNMIQISKDNPFWPNSSAEDRAKDEAAGLPHPQVDGAEWVLRGSDVECLAAGASILGCGGGGDPDSGRLRALKLLKEGKEIKILNPCRVDGGKMGLVCGVGFMGAPAIIMEKLVGGEETMLALTRMEQVLASGVCGGGGGGGGVKVTEETCHYGDVSFPVGVANNDDLANIPTDNIPLNHRITGLTCLEAGGSNSIEPLLVGAVKGLPVLDVDGMGRAFPELQMYIPFMYECDHTPSVLTDCKGEAITCTRVGSAKQLEMFFRVETVRMGMSAAIATGVMDFDTVLSKTVLFTMSQAWQLGRAVLRARHLHTSVVRAIVEQLNGMVLITGKVVLVDRASEGGFTEVISLVEGLEGYSGHYVQIRAKNENYLAQRKGGDDGGGGGGGDGEVLACTPDLITIVDSDTGVPITTEQIRYGLRVGVVVLPANPLLKTPRALETVGPRAFKFNMDYREPRPLLIGQK